MNRDLIREIDRSGNPFTIGICCAEDYPSLYEMYLHFSPRPASQGLPPEDPDICRNWLKNLLDIGINLLAWRGNQVIGHAALIPDLKGKSGEFIVFIDQNNRNLGIGTQLTRMTLERSKQLGFETVWLTVPLTNFIAIKLYKKFGFEYSDKDPYERMMTIQLHSLTPEGASGR
ncbi:MAG: GNAT family N-acetyltransferase [Syntrophaceae bacterium]|nr:GNAT family N-acetyltransferase [Syntrophaceae bacterium]